MYLTILQQIFVFFFFEVVVIDAWSRYFVELLSPSCSPTHNIVPHTSLHDQPCHKTMKKYENSQSMVIFFSCSYGYSGFKNGFGNCQHYLCLFRIVVECSPRKHHPRKMFGSPKSTSLLSTFHIGSRFCFFPANFYVIHNTQIRIILSHDEQRDIPNLEFSPIHVFNRIFSNCLSHNSPAKG